MGYIALTVFVYGVIINVIIALIKDHFNGPRR